MKKILFIGLGESSHTSSWITLLSGSNLDYRLFALPTGALPDSQEIPTYLSAHRFIRKPKGYTTIAIPVSGRVKSFWVSFKSFFFHYNGVSGFLTRLKECSRHKSKELSSIESLRAVLKKFSPDVVHTFGIFNSSTLYLSIANEFPGISWVCQVRGGPDLELNIYDDQKRSELYEVLCTANFVICDSLSNYELLEELGIPSFKFPLGVISGTGGMDFEGMLKGLSAPQLSQNRVVVLPKAYEAGTSKITSIFEAMNMAWDSIKPVSFVFLWMEQEDVKLWMKKVLRPEIIENLTIYGRLPRAQALEIVREARILLAPSLMDGIPNSMLEAMTLGAIPIVSPLKSIRTFVTDENVIFARNLFPEEIASALKEGLEDSDKNRLRISKNFELIKENYDRCKISSRVVQFYNEC